MRRRKLLVILVVALLLFTTVTVSSVFYDEELSDDNFEEFSCEKGSSGDIGICGNGENRELFASFKNLIRSNYCYIEYMHTYAYEKLL